MTPKWTVLYNGPSSRCYAFFEFKHQAQVIYDQLQIEGAAPTLRPFHRYDRLQLGGQV